MHSLSLHHLQLATEWLAQADGLLIAAGAGMGVDSGLPDFRGDQGLWRAYPALARAGLRFVEIANPASFDTDPRLAWGFYGHRLVLYQRTRPHAGFGLLQQLAERLEHGLAVNTSNVDGQFQAAGCRLFRRCGA
ncbi:NAD-dependent deacetylase [Aquabacterium sp.]|uniref:SIR2 family NAD-dependent protein deacylase n=1 Tax=Aquabacterium sp. TaxID=1872578 RepID=UPI00345BD181